MNEEKETAIEFTAAPESQVFLASELTKRQSELQQLTSDSEPLHRANLQYDIGEIMLELDEAGMKEAAWGLLKEAFYIFLEHSHWEDAVQCCDALYRTELDNAIKALGNGIWLAVTFPIDTELSIVMLHNLINDTPNNSDGAAVAAATAHYIADLRLEGEKRDSTMYLTSGLLGKVAERHSQVSSQQEMTIWLNRLELLDTEKFLPRLGFVLDAIVDNDWWYDKDEIRNRIPVH